MPVLVLFLLFYCKMLGAGDIKLLSVLGGFYGWNLSLKFFLLALVYGSIWSIAKLIVHRNLRERFFYFFQYLELILRTKKRIPYRKNNVKDRTSTIPFCVTILMAYISDVWGGVC